MDTKLSQRPNRRDMLKFLTAAGITTAGAYMLKEYSPWIDIEDQVEQARRPFERGMIRSMQMRELVRYATLASNGHNTQPWKFDVEDDSIKIHPDYTRRLAVVDPHDRELWISLGCALENLLIAARVCGFAPQVDYPEGQDIISIRLTADTPQTNPLFDAIPMRQNTRSEYDGRSIHPDDLARLEALPLEPGVSSYFIGHAGLEPVVEYVHEGNLSQYGDKSFLEELVGWLRFNKNEAAASLDGLYSRCSGNPEVPRWIGQMFVYGAKPEQQADSDASKLRTSSGAVVIAAEMDDKVSWIRTGQVYERIALKMTVLNIKSAFINQPIEVAGLRPQFQNAIGLGQSQPQLLVRFGYASSMPRSLRRPVAQVLI